MLPSRSAISAETISTILVDCYWLVAFKIELIVSRKAGCPTIICTRLLISTFPSAAMFINIYNLLMFLERLSREEVATAQLPCAGDINI